MDSQINWLDQYDHYTSDNEHLYDNYMSDDYFFNLYFDYDLGCYYDLELGKLSDKLLDFNANSNQYKRHDRRFNCDSINYKVGYRDSLSTFGEFKDTRNKEDIICGIMRKYKDKPISVIIYKLKNHILYRKSHTFKRLVERYIKGLTNPNDLNNIITDVKMLRYKL